MEKDSGLQRLEAFSDGVFAIAITLLILEVKIPHLDHPTAESLAEALRELWPAYFAYIFSFLMIGIYWVNHHYLFRLYVKCDHTFKLLNVFFLMAISFVPFPTALLGQYVTHPDVWRSAVGFYVLGMMLAANGWLFMWLYASHRYRLLDRRLDPVFVKVLTIQFIISNLIYLLALVISRWAAAWSLTICVVLACIYLLPPKKPVYR